MEPEVLTFDMSVIFPPTVSVWSHYQEQSLIPSYALNLIYTTIFLISMVDNFCEPRTIKMDR